MASSTAINGVVSGIDWDSLRESILETMRTPAYVQVEKRTKLENTKLLWEEYLVSLQSLQSSLSPLKLASTFKAKSVEVERLDSNASAKGVLTAVANADAVINTHDIEVKNLATGQIIRSNDVTRNATLGTLGLTADEDMSIIAGGQKITVTAETTDTIQSLADKISTALKTSVPPVNVTATDVPSSSTEQLVISSDNTGLGTSSYKATVTHKGTSDEVVFSSQESGVELDYDLFMQSGGNNNGTLTVTGSNGTVYALGTDFSIDPDGKHLVWSGGREPAIGDTYTVEYSFNANTFDIDVGSQLTSILGLNDNVTAGNNAAAADATLIIDGNTVTSSSNVIGPAYGNELITGVTMTLRGTGRVALDVVQDAESAVTAIQDFLTNYNDVLSWINTRMTESELDETTAATVDSDDFRLKWGLLNGNSLLRYSKTQMRLLTSQIYSPAFTSARTARASMYGTFAQNGLKTSGSVSLTGTDSYGNAISARIDVNTTDNLQAIVDKINALCVDDTGAPFAKASMTNSKLTITPGTDSLGGPYAVSLGGSTAIWGEMNISYQYNSLSQIGIKTPSTGVMSDDANAGYLEFDTTVFMEAMTNNPSDVANLMTTFAADMQTYLDGMVKSAQVEVGSTTTAQGKVVREINAIDTEIASIDKYLEEVQRRIDQRDEALQAQFATAETMMAEMAEKSSWLSSVISALQSTGA
ncbi:MAG: flagellar filament capping protein FliD [Synergistaceae bacterium]|jgi:flagellar capping protein FliD|nr:flagellar filament capping protein FliD [Synergistaceae bacterium]